MTGTEIRELRQRMGLSQGAFARRIGVSPNAVYRWETGSRHPIPILRIILENLQSQVA